MVNGREGNAQAIGPHHVVEQDAQPHQARARDQPGPQDRALPQGRAQHQENGRGAHHIDHFPAQVGQLPIGATQEAPAQEPQRQYRLQHAHHGAADRHKRHAGQQQEHHAGHRQLVGRMRGQVLRRAIARPPDARVDADQEQPAQCDQHVGQVHRSAGWASVDQSHPHQDRGNDDHRQGPEHAVGQAQQIPWIDLFHREFGEGDQEQCGQSQRKAQRGPDHSAGV
ncbi:hypothetical protein D9M69_537320 [compost metagenome]